MSSANDALRASSTIALPPNFTTTIWPAKLVQPGQRLDEHGGLRGGDVRDRLVDGARLRGVRAVLVHVVVGEVVGPDRRRRRRPRAGR